MVSEAIVVPNRNCTARWYDVALLPDNGGLAGRGHGRAPEGQKLAVVGSARHKTRTN